MKENKKFYSGTQIEGIFQPEGGSIQTMPGEANAPVAIKANTLEKRIKYGKLLYTKTCFACHQGEGQGIANAFPPLAKSDYMNADVNRTIKIVLEGKTGELTVNGKKYNSVMTAQTLTDEEVANVLTYVYNSWGNNKTEVTPDMVTRVRSSH